MNTTNKMNKIEKLPRHGYINELSRLVGCSRETTRKALFNNARGVKAEKVRRLYRVKYDNN